MSCNLNCQHCNCHGSCHGSCHVSSHPTYGWTGQQNLVLEWTYGNRVDSSYKVKASDINSLKNAIKNLNAHNHGNVKLTNNVNYDIVTPIISTLVDSNNRKKATDATDLRPYIDKLATVNSSNHAHRCWYPYSGTNNLDYVRNVIWGSDGTPGAETNHAIPNRQPPVSTNIQVSADVVNALRESIEALQGHQHWMCTCNCNYY